VRTLVLVGFLYCRHPSKTAKKETFWTLVNPELEESIDCGKIKQIFEIMVRIVIRHRLGIHIVLIVLAFEVDNFEEERSIPIKNYLKLIETVNLEERILHDFFEVDSTMEELEKEELISKLRHEWLTVSGLRVAFLIGDNGPNETST